MSKGPDYAIMISDALMAKGTPIGSEYIFGGNHITIYPDGSAHLDNGTLAGSTLNINKGLRILVREAMVPFNYALNACTINPHAACIWTTARVPSRSARMPTLWCWTTTTMCCRPTAWARPSCNFWLTRTKDVVNPL